MPADDEAPAEGLPAESDSRRPVRPAGAPARGRRAARVEVGEPSAPGTPRRPVRPEALGERAAARAAARAAEVSAAPDERPSQPGGADQRTIRPAERPERLLMPRRVLDPVPTDGESSAGGAVAGGAVAGRAVAGGAATAQASASGAAVGGAAVGGAATAQAPASGAPANGAAPLPPAPVLPVAPTASLGPVTAAVVVPTLPEPPRRELTALTHHVIGGGTALLTRQPQAGASKRPLASLPATLPEPTGDDLPKPLRRQPAFVVALIAAIVIVLGVVAFLVLQQVLRGPDTVADLSVLDGGNNYVLQWNGPDVPYSVAVTNAPSSTIDVTRFIKGGREAFVPKAGLGVSKDSCFVVRSQAEATAHPEVPTSTSALSAEGAQRFCVADIGR